MVITDLRLAWHCSWRIRGEQNLPSVIRFSILFFFLFFSLEHSNSQYEAMTSVAKAALHLLRHLLTVNELVGRKRFPVVSGIFRLLDQSLLLVKNSLPTEETSSNVKACKEIFQKALQALHDSLENHFRWNLLRVSENRRDVELQVTLCCCCHFRPTDRPTTDWMTDYV